jgi:type III pantothenate kinase
VWLLDLGNSRLKLARAGADGLGPVLALPYEGPELESRLRAALAGDGAPAWWASVAPDERSARVAAVLAEDGRRVERVHSRREALGLRIAYADPARLGVDRFLALLAARALGGAHLLASFGSALTVDLLDAEGRHRGGLVGIAPWHARQALAARFPALDRGEAEAVPGFADDTPAAVAGGVEAQALGLLLVAWHEARALLPEPPRVSVAGGDATRLAPRLAALLGVPVERAEHRVLEGLHRLAVAEGALPGRC